MCTYVFTYGIDFGRAGRRTTLHDPTTAMQAARAVPRPQPAAVSEFWYELKQIFIRAHSVGGV
jgi:hypothetical protein